MIEAIGVAFLTVFVAELGDKSQLMALTLAARYSLPVVAAAVVTASFVTIGLSVGVGAAIGTVLPTRVLTAVAGVLFVVFGGLMLWGRDEAEEPELGIAPAGGMRGFITVVAALALAELGDKTMVAALALAATGSAVGVWLGGSLGMAAAGLLGVLVGATLWRRLDPAVVRRVAAALFALVGVVLLIEAAQAG